MEYLHNDSGDNNVYRTNDALRLLRWGYRFLYVLFLLTFLVSMGYWHLPHTIYYVAGLLALLLPLIFSEKELFSLEYDVHKCTLEYISEHSSTD